MDHHPLSASNVMEAFGSSLSISLVKMAEITSKLAPYPRLRKTVLSASSVSVVVQPPVEGVGEADIATAQLPEERGAHGFGEVPSKSHAAVTSILTESGQGVGVAVIGGD